MRIVLCSKEADSKMIGYRIHEFPDGNPEEWRGITVFAPLLPDGSMHPDVLPLFGKACRIAKETDDKAQLLIVGDGLVETARSYYAGGADRVFVYDDVSLKEFNPDRYTQIILNFLENYKPALLCFPGTPECTDLAGLILENMKTILPFTGTTETTETLPAAISAIPGHRGELVICEVPEFE